MSRLCVDFTTIGRRGVFLQFKKLDSGQEGNKRLPGFSKTTCYQINYKIIVRELSCDFGEMLREEPRAVK